MMELKEKIVREALRMLKEKVTEMNQQLANIRQSAEADGKSSMGDKYETTREMLKQEEEKVVSQLALCNKQLVTVSNLKLRKCSTAESGALVRAENLYFMILTSLGKIVADGHEVFTVSAIAPISRQLLGKTTGDSFVFNGKSLTIDEIS